MTPTQRTLKALRDKGFKCAIVERWNPHAHIRQDLFGFIDILALDPDRGVVGVQSTGTAFSDHEHKLLEERVEECRLWLSVPGTALELWGWRKLKVKPGGKAYKYEPRVRVFTLADFPGDGGTNESRAGRTARA